MADPTPDPAPPTPPTPAPPVPTPTPAPAPVPDPASLKPGWQTSEAWLSFLIIVLGAIPTSGLVDNAPLAAKIVGLVAAALSAINYTVQRTVLKQVHLAAKLGAAPQPAKTSKLAAVAAAAIVLTAVATILTSCGGSLNCSDPKNAQNAACVVEGALVDCTGISILPAAVVAAEPAVEKLLASAKQADGSFNFAPIESQLVDLALQYGPCVVAEIWNHYMSGTPAGSGMAARTVVANKAAFAAEFDRIRARVAPGRQFKTSGGTL